MKKTLLLILLTLGFYANNAQYVFKKTAYIDNYIFPTGTSPYGNVAFKGIDNYIRVYSNLDSTRVIVKEFDVFNYVLKRTDTIPLNTARQNVSDILPTQSYDIVTGFNRLSIYDRKSHTYWYKKFDSIVFNHVCELDDSLILLTIAGNYHPADAKTGLHLAVFNINSKQTIASKVYQIAGVALSNMTTNWVFTNNHHIIVVEPLNGKMITFDRNLQMVNKIELPVSWENYARNIKYQDSTDSLMYSEWNTIHKRIELLGIDSLRKNRNLMYSPVYSREFAGDVSRTVRAELQFIEKVIPYTTSEVILTVSKPGYGYNTRDLVFYDLKKNRIVKRIENWRCMAKDTIQKVEDYFTINVINDSQLAPFFVGNKIITVSPLNVDLYKPTLKDSLDKTIYKDIKHNSFCYRLFEFSLNN